MQEKRKKKAAEEGAGHRKGKALMTEEEEDRALVEAAGDSVHVSTYLTVQPSVIVGGKMRQYQIQGLNWLIRLFDRGLNGILADEMGLGKTLQTISLLGYLKEFRAITGPHIVIVPNATLDNWIREFKKWCPSLEVFRFHGAKEERGDMKDDALQAGKFDVCVTTYEMAIREKAHLKKFNWRYLVVDEAHRLKNENSKLSEVLRTFDAQFRLLLTGTPLQNNLHELWALLNFLLPEVFSSSDDFDAWFGGAGATGSGAPSGKGRGRPSGKGKGAGEDGDEEAAADDEAAVDETEETAEAGKAANQQPKQLGPSNAVVEQLHKILRPFLLRRLKSDVEKDMPPKTETKLFLGMSPMQREWYSNILQRDISVLNDTTGKVEKVKLLNIVMQLRKACNHPYLFDGAEPGPPYTTDEHLITNSGKMVILDKLLGKLQKQGSRVLIFSLMTRMLDILEDYCIYRGYKYCRLDGNTPAFERDEQIQEYNKPGSEKFIFLLSTRAGGLGINLATADTVILYDSDWNPQVDLQAQDRAHRIGQTKPVHVYRFVTEDAIEEKVIERAERKLHLDAVVIQSGRLVEQTAALSKNEMLSMIRFGADKIFRSTNAGMTDEDIDALIARGQVKTDALSAKLQENARNNLLTFTLDGDEGNMYMFEGKDFSNVNKDKKKDFQWIEPPKREKKSTNYDINKYFTNALSGRSQEPRQHPAPRAPREPVRHDFHFYNEAELEPLFAKERAFYHGKAQPSVSGQPLLPNGLTAAEQARKEQLLKEGFGSWNRRDFKRFIVSCERFGRKAHKKLAEELKTKTPEEVRAYVAAFEKNYLRLPDGEKMMKRIVEGESKIARRLEMEEALRLKVSRYARPARDLRIAYTQNKGKLFTEDEDRFMLVKTHEHGWGMWDEVKADIRRADEFRFDWFLKSRTTIEIGRRVEVLVRMVEKENEDLKNADRRKSGGGGGGGRGGGQKRPGPTSVEDTPSKKQRS